MPNRAALIVDDEPQIRRVVRHALSDDFARVLEADTGERGIDLAAAEKPALIVLDLGLPDVSGVQVCTEIRKWSDAAILVLSARHSDQEKVALLDAGADDYMTKPFSTDELKARVRALLRRSVARAPDGGTTIQCGDLKMDLDARTLIRNGALVHLTPIEWELLRVLMTHAGKTMTHRQLFAAVWPGRAYGDAQQYLRVHVANVRRKVEPDPLSPRYIFTEPGVGYRFASCE
ncbi:MAG TPA: response regulator [Gemmatimonadaceae bacterium]|jgi:two-component system KDP operon response regulator KdpE|nr:response regulator [Gemmatimonadaceae bacterium]